MGNRHHRIKVDQGSTHIVWSAGRKKNTQLLHQRHGDLVCIADGMKFGRALLLIACSNTTTSNILVTSPWKTAPIIAQAAHTGRITLVAIRVMLQGQFPVGLFDLELRGTLFDAQHFVVVFGGCCVGEARSAQQAAEAQGKEEEEQAWCWCPHSSKGVLL